MTDSLRHASALVIGGLGFIGSNLTARLVARGARVTVLTPSLERHEELARRFSAEGVTVIEGDVRDHGLMLDLVAGHACIFNVSGQSGAVKSMEDPWTDLDVNCRGSLTVLESVRVRNPRAKIVAAGSRLQYGKPGALPVVEDSPKQGLSLHAIHKQTVEEYFKLYARLFEIRFSVARITNPYGPGQASGRTAYGIINRLIQLAIAGEPLTIYGAGTQVRDYLHVDDVVSALIALGESPKADGGVFNVASGTPSRLVDVAAQIIDLAGAGRIQHVEWPRLAEQVESGDFVADISRIRQVVGWSPTIGLTDGLKQTIEFYRS